MRPRIFPTRQSLSNFVTSIAFAFLVSIKSPQEDMTSTRRGRSHPISPNVRYDVQNNIFRRTSAQTTKTRGEYIEAEMLQISRGATGLTKLIAGLILLGVVETDSAKNSKRIHRDFSYPVIESFDVYWNVPTFACQKFNVNFEPELKKYGIIVNSKDQFRGEKMVILYDPGLFPAMLEDTSSGKLKARNGGIPQLGSIDDHLREFRGVMEKVVPKDFSGVGVIDFEAYRPVWRQNWKDQLIYKNMSMDLERQRNPQLNEEGILQRAKDSFEAGAKVFMDETLKLAKSLRPNARWGYYGFPYCFNSGVGSSVDCTDLVRNENNQIQWLFSDSTAFYPSVYVNNMINANQVKSLVIGRLNEAWRMAKRVSNDNPPPVYPYVGFRHPNTLGFVNENKMFNILDTIKQYKMGGAIIWGSSNQLRSKEQCMELFDYLQKVLGPIVQRVKANNGGTENMKSGNVKVNGYISQRPDENVYDVPRRRRPFAYEYQDDFYYPDYF